MSKALAIVVPLPGGLPPTLPSTLEKVLNGAVLTEESLLLRLDSVALTLRDGTVLTTSDLRNLLTLAPYGYVKLSEFNAFSRY